MNSNTELVPLQSTPGLPALTGTTQELIAAFFAGRNARTLQAYRQDLDDFRSFLGMASINEAAGRLFAGTHGAANHIALSYKADMTTRGLQPTTINRRLAALRSLVKLASTLGLVPWSLQVENVKVKAYRDTRGPGRGGYCLMLQAAAVHRDQRIRLRNLAILHMLHDLALRRGEVVALDLADIDLQSGMVAILGKGRTQKEMLTLPEPTKAALQAWMNIRGTSDGPLFFNFDHAGKGERLTGTSLYRLVRQLGEDVGVKTRPHGLRHTAITEACKAAQAHGIDLEEVLDFSRHSDVKTLMIYRDRERNVQGRLAALVAAGM